MNSEKAKCEIDGCFGACDTHSPTRTPDYSYLKPAYRPADLGDYPWLTYDWLYKQYVGATKAFGHEPKYIVTSPELFAAIKSLWVPPNSWSAVQIHFMGLKFGNAQISWQKGLPNTLFFSLKGPSSGGVWEALVPAGDPNGLC